MQERPADEQLEAFLQKYTPEVAGFARTAVARSSERLPAAHRMVYDNYNALVVSFGPNERPSDAIFSLAIYPRYVSLCFLHGARLPDPDGLLQGDGNVVRHVRLASPDDISAPPLASLIDVALAHADVPMPEHGAGSMVIRSISAKQRPRRPSR